jgi:flagellar FliJ protein
MTDQLRKRAPGRGSVDLAGLQVSEVYRRRLAQECTDAERSLVDREVERLKTQGRYLEASRDRKVLQRLRERRERQYYREQKREEFAEMDDLSQAAHARLRGVLNRAG